MEMSCSGGHGQNIITASPYRFSLLNLNFHASLPYEIHLSTSTLLEICAFQTIACQFKDKIITSKLAVKSRNHAVMSVVRVIGGAWGALRYLSVKIDHRVHIVSDEEGSIMKGRTDEHGPQGNKTARAPPGLEGRN